MGSVDDFEAFVTAKQRSLLRTAWLLTGNWASAEDLVQSALVRAWPHWQRVTQEGSAEAYVRRVMVNQALDWRRRRWTGETPTAELPERGISDSTEQADLRNAVVQAVGSLPPRQRVAVVLRYFDDLSVSDVASAMGCSQGTVKSQVARAVATLRRHPGLADLDIVRSVP